MSTGPDFCTCGHVRADHTAAADACAHEDHIGWCICEAFDLDPDDGRPATTDEPRGRIMTDGYGVIPTDGRHPATVQLARWLTANPNLPDGTPRAVARLSQALAAQMVTQLPDGPELSAGLRKLLEAKDCFVRAALPEATP